MALPLPAVFADLPDPRRETRNKLHALAVILTLDTCDAPASRFYWDHSGRWSGLSAFPRWSVGTRTYQNFCGSPLALSV